MHGSNKIFMIVKIDWVVYNLNTVCENTIFSENFNNIAVGSAPGVKTNTNGDKQFESSKVVAKSNGGGSVNFFSNTD